VATGVIDVSMHRDDVGMRVSLPVVRASQLPKPLEERTVVIVDDVLFTGRTCRAAMDAIRSFGRPPACSLPPWSIAGIAIYRSGRISSARIFPRRVTSRCGCAWQRLTRSRMGSGFSKQMNSSILRWTRKDLLGLRELSAEEINFVLETADAFKQVGTREVKESPGLAGKDADQSFYRAEHAHAHFLRAGGQAASAPISSTSARRRPA
jgi:hypothetical protein